MHPSWALDRAITSGYDSACASKKDGDSPYHNCHPLFRWWWEAVVMKSDIPDYGLERVKKEVLQRVKSK